MNKKLIQIRVTEITKQIRTVSGLISKSGYYKLKRYLIKDIKYKRKYEIRRLLNMQVSKMEDYSKKVQKLRWWIRQLLRENRRLIKEKLKWKTIKY